MSKNINSVKIFFDEELLTCYVYLKEEDNTNWNDFFEEINKEVPKYEAIKKYEIFVDSLDKRLKQ